MLRLAPCLLLALFACAEEPAPKDSDTDDTDTGSTVTDNDGDGYAQGADCDDTDGSINPGATETWYDGIDQNCDGNDDDQDGDTYGLADDCDDTAAAVNPAAEEVCDTVDNDCDGTVDQGAEGATTTYEDADVDGYGNPEVSFSSCDGSAPAGYVADNTDCDDTDATSNPAGTEICDGADNNCDGTPDEGLPSTPFYADADTDGYGDPAAMTEACVAPEGHVTDNTDCNDADALVNPAAAEICDDVDNNCEGTVDEDAADAGTWYADDDADTYGDPLDTLASCDAPGGYVSNSDDCDDADVAVNPSGTEACNGYDDDCDGETDEAGATGESTFYADDDGDGYGDPAVTGLACDAGAGWAANDDDCDDTDADISPAADEECDAANTDEDCDGTAEESGATGEKNWYADDDGDGYGDPAVTAVQCDTPSDYVSNKTDCDDTDGEVNPGATEACNDYDDDCDSAIDEAGASGEGTWYYDLDGDSYGDPDNSETACDQPAGTISDSDDCDDSDDQSYPGATELCDGEDNDCDGATSDEGGQATFTDGLTWTDVTASVQGTSTSPKIVGDGSSANYKMTSGTLYLCDGTWYTKVVTSTTTTDITVVGRNGASDTVMTTNGTNGSIVAATNSVVTIEGVSLTGGIGSTSGTSQRGGAVSVSHTTGGAVPATPDLTLIDCVIEDNTANYGGAAQIENYGWLALEDTIVQDNIATVAGGGVWMQLGGKLTCEATGLGLAGFYTNTAVYGGGVYLSGSSVGSFTSTGCDFGEDASSDDNTAYDVSLQPATTGKKYCYGHAASLSDTITCSGGTCTASTETPCP